MTKQINYMLVQKRQKMQTKAYALLCLVLTIAVGFFSYQKWNEYSFVKQVVERNTELVAALKKEASDEKSEYDTKKDEFMSLNKEIEDKLAIIFPETDDYTNLTRQLDLIEKTLTKPNSPFEVSSIQYQTPIKSDKYSLLPFTMNISSSADNFEKFLHSIENSGSLLDQIRLMDISSIRLSFGTATGGLGGGESDIITFTVQINAYYQ